MTHGVVVPFWLLAILIALALWAALEHLFTPTARWFFRRRVKLVVHELRTRLKIEIPQFKLLRREVLIDRLFHDPAVQEAAQTFERNSGLAREEVLQRVERYAREIVPSFNAYIYFRIGYWIAKGVARFLYRVRLGYTDEAGLASVSPKSTVVFVINHRSNMDYVLVAFLAAERTALSYAVGEWARIWPLQTLIRAMGAYFVRRNSNDPLYRAVLQRYVQMATQAGVCQAVFPEGGLSTDGRLRAPKLGLLDYMTKGFGPDTERDLVFVPVGINYDRVLEDRTLLLETAPGTTRRGMLRTCVSVAAFILKNLWLYVRGRWYRFGYACVNFGAPVSLRDYIHERDLDFRQLTEPQRHEAVAALGSRLMAEIGKVIPVLPVSLVASLFLRNPTQRFSELELKFAAYSQMSRLEGHGAHLYVPRQDHDYAIHVGLRMLTLRRVVSVRDGLYQADPGELAILRYYANAIEHALATERSDQPMPEFDLLFDPRQE